MKTALDSFFILLWQFKTKRKKKVWESFALSSKMERNQIDLLKNNCIYCQQQMAQKPDSHPAEHQQEEVELSFVKKNKLFDEKYDKYEYVLANLLPFKDELHSTYLQDHNQYLYNIINGKLRCYEKFNTEVLEYYQCYDRVEKMIRTNYSRLENDSSILSIKLDNCLSKCSSVANSNEDFKECTQGRKGCFQKYKKKAHELYKGMYKIILQKPQ